MTLTPITRPIRRLLRDLELVIEIRTDGLAIRGHRKRKWHVLTWQQILSLLADEVDRRARRRDEETPIIREAEHRQGEETLARMTRRENRNRQTKKEPSPC